MEINFGSNVISNTNGVLVIDGENQIQIEVGSDGQLLLTMNIYSAKCNQVGIISRNNLMLDGNDGLEISPAPKSLNLFDANSGECVLGIKLVEGNIVQILNGTFYTCRGKLVEVAPDHYCVEGLVYKDSIVDARGKSFVVC